MRFAWGLFLVGACGDKVVTVSINMPANATGYDASCITTIDFYTDGPDYPGNEDDYESGHVAIDANSIATLADVPAAIEGKINISIPSSGLGYFELYGWNGASGFDSFTSEEVFYGANAYIGDDVVTLDIIPNISCAHKPVVVRPLDLIGYQTSKTCATSGVTSGSIFTGSITPRLVNPVIDYWGGIQSGVVAATGANVGTATISASTTMGPDNCFAFSTPGAVSCAVFGAGVCSHGNEFELPLISDDVITASKDNQILLQFPGMVFGAIYTSALAPQAGATVAVDPMLGKVVYVDLVSNALVANAGTSTSASGMFILYTNTVLDATITAGAITKKVRMGALQLDGDGDVPGNAPSTATIVMTPGTTP